MKTKTKQLKVLAIVSVFTVFFAAASVVYGGLSWTGFDPAITLDNGDVVNVVVRVYCTDDIQGPINVVVRLPRGVSVGVDENGNNLVTESPDVCVPGLSTTTTIKSHNDDSIKVEVRTRGKVLAGVEIITPDGTNACSTEKASRKAKCEVDYGHDGGHDNHNGRDDGHDNRGGHDDD